MLQIVGFEREPCGCLVGRYRNTATDRESAYVEAPAATCLRHRRNEPVDGLQRNLRHPADRPVLLAGASCPRPGREGALENALERAVVLGFVFGAYPASAAIRVGQLGPFVVLALVGAALLLTDRTEPARLSRDGLGATLLVLAQVKPTLSIPFVPLILLRAGRVRPAAFAALGYGATSVLSTTLRGEDPVTPVLAWLRLGGSLHYFLEGHANLYKVLALTGGQSLALPASLVLLAGLAIWVHRRPGVDVWTVLGVTALVARLWTHHRLHDDVLLLLPIVALARIARDGSGSRASRIATAALLVNAALLLAPARVLALPLPTALLLEGPQVVVWVGTLVFLATRSEATRGENDEAGAHGHARAPA